MRKALLFISLALSLTFLLSCNKEEGGLSSGATGVVLSKENIEMQVGQTAVLTARVIPETFDQSVIWASLDTSIVKVSAGNVTSFNTGVTYVVATSRDGNALSSCLVSVNPPKRYTITVKDSGGEEVKSVYSYPGYSTKLDVSTSDGVSHTFTWESTNPDAFTVEDGLLELKYQESSDGQWLYYGEGNIVLRSEDGYGCSIPVTSSIGRALWMNDELRTFGESISVSRNSEHRIGASYYDGLGFGVLPMGRYTLTSSDSGHFSLSEESGLYKLTVSDNDDIRTSLTMSLPNGRTAETLSIVVEKHYGINATLISTSSSTLVYSWTEGGSVAEDIADAYTVTLYDDSACTLVNQTFDIPEGCRAWNNKTPRMVMGGLNPSTTYWFRVYDTTNGEESAAVEATTDNFTIVGMPSCITQPGVVLAEDFGEICWDFDYPSSAVGFRPKDNSRFSNKLVNTSETNVSNLIFGGYHACGGGGEMTFKGQGTALSNSTRLNGWLQDSYIYIHPGHIKLGTSSAKGWILTPEFTVPEGKKAIVSVSITAGRYNSSQESLWAIGVLTPSEANATPSSHSADFSWPASRVSSNYQEVSITNSGSWQSKSVSELEVHHGDRIVFGPRLGADTKKSRCLLTDLTVTVTEILDE